MMLGCNEPRENIDPACFDREIMITAAERNAAHLLHPKPSAFCAIFESKLLQKNHPMRNRVQMHVAAVSRQIVQQEHGAFSSGKKMLQRQDLPAIAQRVLREQPHF
jgi:hypothetical protein